MFFKKNTAINDARGVGSLLVNVGLQPVADLLVHFLSLLVIKKLKQNKKIKKYKQQKKIEKIQKKKTSLSIRFSTTNENNLLRRGCLAGANGPHGLIGDDDLGPIVHDI